MKPLVLSGLDLLPTAVVLVDAQLSVQYLNPAAENLFEMSSKSVSGQPLEKLVHNLAVIERAVSYARTNNCSYTEHDLELGINGRAHLYLSCTVTPVDLPDDRETGDLLLLEFRHVERQLRIAREARILEQSAANRELIRNLAHEIKNPLGGIRGAAQLLDRELDRPDLHEYTRVIMNEADRLRSLMERLLTPHRLPRPASLSIHEVLDRVRSVILAEYPEGITIERDYDVSLPTLVGDKEQLIQAVLNIARNAAQALQGHGEIRLKTRIVRQITLARRRYRHAIAVDICDNGPGIPEELQERIFHPLVSGRPGGSGVGLTLAQAYVTAHHGMIYFESVPGATIFTILLPIEEAGNRE